MTVRVLAIDTRRIVRLGTCALSIGVVAIFVGMSVSAQKGKPVPHGVATVVFADRVAEDGMTTDGLTSDGGGAYGTAAIGPDAGDLRLDLAGTGRTINVRLGAALSVAQDAVVPQHQVLPTDAVLFVAGVRSVARGTTVTRVGRIGLGSSYPNHALGFRFTTAQGVEIQGTELCVSRRDVPGAVWDISSSCAIEPSDTAGFFEENLKGKVNHKFKATYTVPFAITVTCTANCPQ